MILDNFKNSFVTAGFPCRACYTQDMAEITDEYINNILATSNDNTCRVIQIGQDIDQLLSDWSLSTYYNIQHGRLFMYTFHKQPKACVTKFHAWLASVYVSNNGLFGPFGQKEFDELKLWKFEPVGGIQNAASVWSGNGYYTAQPIEYAAQIL